MSEDLLLPGLYTVHAKGCKADKPCDCGREQYAIKLWRHAHEDIWRRRNGHAGLPLMPGTADSDPWRNITKEQLDCGYGKHLLAPDDHCVRCGWSFKHREDCKRGGLCNCNRIELTSCERIYPQEAS